MKKNQGFTLIELLVAVTVFSILVAVGLPQLTQMTNYNRMISDINSVTGALSVARSESIRRGRVVTMCGSTDQATCNSTEWEDGWIMFMDANRDNAVDAGDTMLRIGDPLTAGNTLRLANSDVAGVIQFKPDGTVRDRSDPGDGFDQGTFILCDQARADDTGTDHEERARAVNLNRLGRASRAEDTDDPVDNIVDNVNNGNITCPA